MPQAGFEPAIPAIGHWDRLKMLIVVLRSSSSLFPGIWIYARRPAIVIDIFRGFAPFMREIVPVFDVNSRSLMLYQSQLNIY